MIALAAAPIITEANSSITVPEIDPHTLHDWLNQPSLTLVDVREPDEFALEAIAGAILRPLAQLDGAELAQWPGLLVLYCRSGRRSALAGQQIFSHRSGELVHLQGGILAWKAAGYPITVRNGETSIARSSNTSASTAATHRSTNTGSTNPDWCAG